MIKTMAKEIRLLQPNEIEVRIGNSNKNKTGFSLLLYKNARVDMAILDEVYGPENWQREHKELKGVIYCGVSINYGSIEKPYWVTKWDAGSESNTEAEKGAASDSFKRACTNATGVGRELYTAPFIWLNGNPDDNKFTKWQVQEIGYNDRREIIKLVIVDAKTKQPIYTYGTNARTDTQAHTQTAATTTQPPMVSTMPTQAEQARAFIKSNVNAFQYYQSIYNEYATADEFPEGVLLAIYAQLKKNNKI